MPPCIQQLKNKTDDIFFYKTQSMSTNFIVSFRWISAATGVISFIIFLPGIFTEYYIAEKELDALKKLADEDLKKKQSENEVGQNNSN